MSRTDFVRLWCCSKIVRLTCFLLYLYWTKHVLYNKHVVFLISSFIFRCYVWEKTFDIIHILTHLFFSFKCNRSHRFIFYQPGFWQTNLPIFFIKVSPIYSQSDLDENALIFISIYLDKCINTIADGGVIDVIYYLYLLRHLILFPIKVYSENLNHTVLKGGFLSGLKFFLLEEARLLP